MRARHRHLNPKSCGAVIAFDSRYINYANDALVDSWTERASSVSYTGAGTARPTFKERVSGGSPMVLSAAGNRLNGNATAYITGTNTGGSSFVFVGSGTTAGQVAISIRSTTANREFLMFFQSGTSFWAHRGGTNGRKWSRLNSNVIGIESLANGQPRVNGATVTATAHTHGGSGNANCVVSATQSSTSLIGHLGQVLCFTFVISDSALKKVTHAAAYSFKITCS